MKYIKSQWPVFILILFSLFIASVNFIPGTWLSGWDNLHPEFNLALNIKRSLFSAWQEYQGLGLLGSFGHAADLPRQIFLWLTSWVVPAQYLRYLFTFLMLILGPIGVYVLMQQLLTSWQATPEQSKELFTNQNLNLRARELEATESRSSRLGSNTIAAFMAGLFYLLNLGTVQIFYVPLESFVAHYGFLPWLLVLLCHHLHKPTRHSLFLFTLVSVLTTTQFYVPPIFVVYFSSMVLVCLAVYLQDQSTRIIKASFQAIIATIIANAFWLFPFVYFSLTNASIVAEAHENFMATEDVFLRNFEFGTLPNVAILRGFWFKFIDMRPNREFFYMIGIWRDHLQNGAILAIGYALFGLVLLGTVATLKKGNRSSLVPLVLFLFSFTMLATATTPFSFIVATFTKLIPLFGQVFRVPFTKFAVLATLSYSLLFGFAVSLLIDLGKKYLKQAYLLIPTVISIFLVIFVSPIFSGNLFYEYARLDIPKDYFQTMEFFQSQDPHTRIANFPQLTYWGWNHFDWGYRGSGFWWYGLPQPIMDRAFDGGNHNNENYYWEASLALNEGDPDSFYRTLAKYHVNWLLVDGHLISPFGAEETQKKTLETMIARTPMIQIVKTIGSIKIYRVNLPVSPDHFVLAGSNLPMIDPAYAHGQTDKAFEEYGDYVSVVSRQSSVVSRQSSVVSRQSSAISDQSSDNLQLTTYNPSTSLRAGLPPPTIYYPFRTLFTGRKQSELTFTTQESTASVTLTTTVPKQREGQYLFAHPQGSGELQLVLDGQVLDYQRIQIRLPPITEGKLDVQLSKSPDAVVYDSDRTQALWKNEPINCNLFNKGKQSSFILSEDRRFRRMQSKASSLCEDLILPKLPTDEGYLISLKTRHVKGKSILFWVKKFGLDGTDFETFLSKDTNWHSEYYIIPPKPPGFAQYHLHFDNTSIGDVETVNDIARVTVYKLPYGFLSSMKIINSPNITNLQPTTNIRVSHPNESLYVVSLQSSVFSRQSSVVSTQQPVNLQPTTYNLLPTTLILSQAYDSGWKAYEISCKWYVVSCKLGEFFPFLFGKEIKDHVLVNNWANGWQLPQLTTYNLPFDSTQGKQPTTILIVYLPQYLQYLGFALLFGTFGYFVYMFRAKES